MLAAGLQGAQHWKDDNLIVNPHLNEFRAPIQSYQSLLIIYKINRTLFHLSRSFKFIARKQAKSGMGKQSNGMMLQLDKPLITEKHTL